MVDILIYPRFGRLGIWRVAASENWREKIPSGRVKKVP